MPLTLLEGVVTVIIVAVAPIVSLSVSIIVTWYGGVITVSAEKASSWQRQTLQLRRS